MLPVVLVVAVLNALITQVLYRPVERYSIRQEVKTMSDSVIRLSGFYYAYPQSDVLLKDINLSVEKVPLRPSQDPAAPARRLSAGP